MATTQETTTAQQLLDMPGLGRCELVQGELIMMSPAGFEHGRIVARITAPLTDFVEDRSLGIVTGAETGFLIERDPDTVRAPDVGFVRAERVPPTPKTGFFEGPPDLAVEVLSPSDAASDVLAKVHDWLSAGCQAVWVLDPATRTAVVHRMENRSVVSNTTDVLTDEDLLPHFRLAVERVFAS